MLYKYVHRLRVLLVLLVDEEGLLVQAVFRSNLGNLADVVVLELVDVANDLALVCADRGKHQQVLEILVVAERRRLQDDLLKKLNELNREVRRQESLDSDRDIIRVSALRKRCGNDLYV